MKKVIFPLLAFCSLILFCNVSIAAVDLPPVKNKLGNGYTCSEYLIYQDNDGTYRYIAFGSSDGNVEINITVDTVNNVTTFESVDNEPFRYSRYSYDSTTNSWKHSTTPQNDDSDGIYVMANDFIESFTILESTSNVYDSNGTLFFPNPPEAQLYQMIQKVITEEMGTQQKTLVGTMKILMVCGVGLMSLLIGLVLFGKVLRPYLQR